MTDMFIPKKERILIAIEAIVYVFLIILASYFTISGNIFIKMVPMLYFLGVLGIVMFKKPISTVMLGTISILVFGFVLENKINKDIILFAIYSGFMIAIGEITGYVLNVLYENLKLRKFIKYYHKIWYILCLVISILLPLFLNNLVNSNFISYLIAKNSVNKYIRNNYAYSFMYINGIKYIPSYEGGIYEFNVLMDDMEVKLNYSKSGEIADLNMDSRKDVLNTIANAEMSIMLRQNNLTKLNITCRYDYSKIATNPDIIKISIENVSNSEIGDIVKYIKIIRNWDKFCAIDRIDVLVDNINVTIDKKDLNEKDITESYILNGTKQETLDSKGGI